MIHFTAHIGSKSWTFALQPGQALTIGAGEGKGIDIPLVGEGITEKHVLISCQEDGCWAHNAANDPFCTINGEAFGRRCLVAGDSIEVGCQAILCEIEGYSKRSHPLPAMSTEELVSVIGYAISVKEDIARNTLLELEEELEFLVEESDELYGEHEDLDSIEALMREVEALPNNDAKEPIPSLVTATPYLASPVFSSAGPHLEPIGEKTVELKRCHTEEKREEGKGAELSESRPTRRRSFQRWWLGIVAVAGTLMAILFIAYVLNLQTKKKSDELLTAEAVADIAMALTYAHFNHTNPQKQNWADPTFIRKNLGAILSPQYQILAHFDAQGQFTQTPYLLRIYTTQDLSHFLVMAQPAPRLTQWLAPKDTIVVDSRAMELRKLKDVRALNRLLVHAKTFDTAQTDEISRLVESGTLIPLNALAVDNKKGFAPPRSLAMMQPQAKDRIYNAPRYFLFGERILDKVSTTHAESAAGEMATLHEELEALQQLPHLVLYSTGGIAKALEAQQALSRLTPQHPFWVGYLQLGPQGQLLNGQLLLRGDTAANLERSFSDDLTFQEEHLPAYNGNFAEELHQKKIQRIEALAPLYKELFELLQEQQSSYDETKAHQIRQSLQNLERAEREQRYLLRNQIHQLLAQAVEIPLPSLLKMFTHSEIKDIELDPLLLHLLYQQRHRGNYFARQKLKIKQATNPHQLANRMKKAHHYIRSGAEYQKWLSETINKLIEIYLWPSLPLLESSTSFPTVNPSLGARLISGDTSKA